MIIDARKVDMRHPLAANEHADIRRYTSPVGNVNVAAQALDFGTFIDAQGVSSPLSATDYIVTDADGSNIRRFIAEDFERLFTPA